MLRRGTTLLQKIERALEAELDAGDSRSKPPQYAVANSQGHGKRKKGKWEKGTQCDEGSGTGHP